MKKIFVSAFCSLFIGLGYTSAHAISLGFNPPSQSVPVGSSVTVDLTISGLGNLSAPSLGVYDLDVTFDPTILSFNSVTFGDPVLGNQLDLFGFGSIATFTPGGGTVNLFELSLDFPSNLDTLQAGAFTLAVLSFNAINAGTGTLGIGLHSLGDSLGLPLAASVQTGSVTATVAPVPEPTSFLILGSGLVGLIAIRKRLAKQKV